MDLKVTKDSLSSNANYKCLLSDDGLHSYRMRTFGAKCIFWDARNEVWSSHGCKVCNIGLYHGLFTNLLLNNLWLC